MVLTLWKKQELRTMIRALLGDQSGGRVGGAVLDLLTESMHDAMWTRVLDKRPYFVSQLDTVTTLTSPGYLNVAASGGHLSKRLFRIQDIVRSGQSYHQLDPRHLLLEDIELQAANNRSGSVYAVLGSQIHLFPYETTPEVEVRYSFLPAKYAGLADTATFDWPEGHELTLAFGVVSLLDKDRQEKAEELEANMHNALGRVQLGPTLPFHGTTAKALGGE